MPGSRLGRRDGEGACGRTMQPLPIIRGRLSGDAPEHSIELRKRLEAGLVGGLADAAVWIHERVFHAFDAHPRQVFREGEAARILEHLAKVRSEERREFKE